MSTFNVFVVFSAALLFSATCTESAALNAEESSTTSVSTEIPSSTSTSYFTTVAPSTPYTSTEPSTPSSTTPLSTSPSSTSPSRTTTTSTHTPETTTAQRICYGSTPCGWAVYVPFTRRIDYFMRNICVCPSQKSCQRFEDDLSISAYVYRCGEKLSTTEFFRDVY